MGRLQFAQDGDHFIGWDEYNGQPGFQPDGDYMRFINGYGRKKVSQRKIDDFMARAAALDAAG
jgi:hypothetical protein